MLKTLGILNSNQIESSTTSTPLWETFVKTFKKEFNLEIRGVKGSKIRYNIGHFTISGFFTKDNQVYYFSLPDIRHSKKKILIRTALNYDDYTGGYNNMLNIERFMLINYFNN